MSLFGTIGLGKERDYFSENLSLLVASGMSILDAIDATKDGVRTRRMKRLLLQIRNDIEAGAPLWKALDKTRLYPKHAVSLIRLGEESGRLTQNITVVAGELQKTREFKSKLRSAMLYPVFVLSVTLVVGIGIAWFILPKLAVVFASLNVELPVITRLLIRGGVFLDTHGVIVVPAFFVVLCGSGYFLFFMSKTKWLGQSMMLHLPGVSRLIREIELARFGYVLGTLLTAGLPISQALESLRSSSEMPQYKKLFGHIAEHIEEGNSFQKSFSSYRNTKTYIPHPIQQLLIAGERSGSLPETLLKIGSTYEAKSDITIKNLTVMMEPILLVIIWLGVVAVALAVILPIYSLVGGFTV